jgi:hypothetical protein
MLREGDMPWLRKYDGSVTYVERDGVGGWIEVPSKYWPDPSPVAPAAVPPKPIGAVPTDKPTTPSEVRQFMCQIGRRGGLQRCRNFARRTPRGWIRFKRRYQHDPSQVSAAPVSASPEVQTHLRECASRGGQERARRYPRETRRAWAAMGGRAKAAKSRRPPVPQHSI